MIFHWKLSKNVVETTEVKFGFKISGMRKEGKRPDYVTITQIEIDDSNLSEEQKKSYLFSVVYPCLRPENINNRGVFIRHGN